MQEERYIKNIIVALIVIILLLLATVVDKQYKIDKLKHQTKQIEQEIYFNRDFYI